jgi:hypothetical protein
VIVHCRDARGEPGAVIVRVRPPGTYGPVGAVAQRPCNLCCICLPFGLSQLLYFSLPHYVSISLSFSLSRCLHFPSLCYCMAVAVSIRAPYIFNASPCPTALMPSSPPTSPHPPTASPCLFRYAYIRFISSAF